jgi:hypothetical protein
VLSYYRFLALFGAPSGKYINSDCSDLAGSNLMRDAGSHLASLRMAGYASHCRGWRLVRNAALCLGLLFVAGMPAWSQSSAPAFTTFNVTGAGTGVLQGTAGSSINASGEVTGIYLTAPNVAHGFVRLANGTINVFDAPGAGTGLDQGTFPISINSSGVITGFYYDGTGNAPNTYSAIHGFVCTAPCAAGTINTFNAPGASTIGNRGTTPISINDSGVIVGSYLDSNANSHGFVCTAPCSTITTFNISGAGSGAHVDQGTFPFSINASGVITGHYTDGSNLSHGFVCTNPCTTSTPFVAPLASTTGGSSLFVGTVPLSINAAGVITGIYSDASSLFHGFVRAANGTITAIDAPGAATSGMFPGTFTGAINAAGDIGGLYFDTSNVIHGFVRSANGTITAFEDPSEAAGAGSFHGTLAISMNAAGAATGGYFDALGVFHGFVRTPGTTNTLTPVPIPSVYGQLVTFTAAISSGDVTPPDGESVSFMQGATTLGTGNLSGGSATFMTSTLAAGTSSITAVYAGDANFVASTSNAVSQVVSKAATSTGVVPTPNPSSAGQSVTLTATVSVTAPGAGNPTGTVTFFDATTTLGTGQLNAGGVATFMTSTLASGSHSITATYAGDANFTGSTAPAVSQTVQGGTTPSSTGVGPSANPSVFGQSVTFTATVTGSGGTPTGTVTFYDNTTSLGVKTLAAGSATLVTSALTAGSHSITAQYGGDNTFVSSMSAQVTQVVNKASTFAVVTPSVNPSIFGQSLTLTATVSVNAPGTGIPTGTVTFMDGSTTLGAATLNASGLASFPTAALVVGSHSITAIYNGDVNFNTSTSGLITQVVNKANTTTGVVSSANPSIVGASVTFTATVSATAPGAGTPTGTVTFFDGTTSLSAVALTGGVAALPISTLTVAGSPHSITASYSGDANFVISTSSPALAQVVNSKPSTTTLTSSLNPEVAGQLVTFTATVTSTAGGTPTGTVTFNGTTSGPVALTAGVATFTTTALAVGTPSISASYSGDANYAASASSPALTETVTAAGFAPAPAGLTVAAGSSLPINLTLYAAKGSGLSFTLSVPNAPSKSTFLFSQNPVAPGPPPNGTTIQVTLMTASSRLPAGPSNHGPSPWGIPGISVALTALLAAGMIFRRRTPRWRLAFSMCLTVVALAMVLTSCGSTSTYTGTTKGADTFNVVGVSGNTMISVPVTVTVQ